MKHCAHCTKTFKPVRVYHMFCSKRCANAYNKGKTWESYFRRLLQNSARARRKLSVKVLMDMFEKQEGKCALSGVLLTKIAGKGVVSTNASIDRIIPSGPYTKENSRLVCTFVNSFRGNVTDKELVWWAERIAEND